MAARRMGLDPTIDDVVQIAAKTLRANLRSFRAGKVFGDFAGYFYGSMVHQLAVYRRRINDSIYNWLGVSYAAAEAAQEVATAMQEVRPPSHIKSKWRPPEDMQSGRNGALPTIRSFWLC